MRQVVLGRKQLVRVSYCFFYFRNQLVLRWVTASWFNYLYLGLTNYPGQLSLATPLWVDAISTDQRAVMLRGWGLNVFRVWWQVKLCDH